MYIYIGSSEIIKTENIICVLDYQLMQSSSKFKKFIKQRKNKIHVIGDKKDIKSIIITDDELYYSPLSTITLKKRDDIYTTITNSDTISGNE